MKILIVASSLIAFSAFAMGELGELKKDASVSIGREISSLQRSQTCVNGAKTLEEFKACNYHSDMDMQKEEEGMREDVEKKIDTKMDSMKDKTMQKKEEVIEKEKDLEKAY